MRTEDGYVIGKCLGGDSAAFGLLVDKYKESVYALAYSKLGNFHDAEDVTQEVFIKAYQKLKHLKRWDSFFAWIYSITSNLCKMHIRSRSRRPDRDYLADQDRHLWTNLSQETHRNGQTVECLHDALSELPETYRQVLTLYYLSGMKIREIARFLGTSADTVKMRLSRARTKLRGEMIAMMNTTFEKHRLAPGFTFRIVEMIKQTKIQPNPPAPWLPWGFSLTTGLLIALLSFAPSKILPDSWHPLAATPIPSQTRIVQRGEIPVEMIEISDTAVFGGDPVKRQFVVANESDDQKKAEVKSSTPFDDPSAENLEPIPIATAPGEQYRPQAVDDGAGGLIVVWIDERSEAGFELYAQRLDASGQPQWQDDGVRIGRGKVSQNIPQLVRSGDKVMVVWQDPELRDHAQTVNRKGVILWDEDGIFLPRRVLGQANPTLLPDGAGGFFIIRSYEGDSSRDYFIQRLDAMGQLMGDPNGVRLFPKDSQPPDFDRLGAALVVSDNKGGFYFVWYYLTDECSIVAYRFNPEAELIWKSPILVATLEARVYPYPFAISDGQGGVIIAWQQYHPQKFAFDNIYAQRVDPNGKILWGKNGVTVCDSPGTEQPPNFTDDGTGGVVAVWQDDRDIFPDIYAQRIRADGKPKWKVNGIALCVAGGHQTHPVLSRSRDGQFFATWLDFREDYDNETQTAIYAQKFGLDGATLWAENGVQICSAAGDSLLTAFAANATSGELKVLWTQAGDILMRRLQ